MNIVDNTKTKMKGAIEHLHQELKSIRTGRANPSMLDNVSVEVYGTTMRIKEVASITTPEPRLLLITPFDSGHAAAIGKAIDRANIGVTPIVDGNVVRIKIAQMDANMRKTMVKTASKMAEEAKISVRNIRRDANEEIRKQKADGTLPEDQMKKLEKNIQEQTDKFCKEIDNIFADKEKEILTV